MVLWLLSSFTAYSLPCYSRLTPLTSPETTRFKRWVTFGGISRIQHNLAALAELTWTHDGQPAPPPKVLPVDAVLLDRIAQILGSYATHLALLFSLWRCIPL